MRLATIATILLVLAACNDLRGFEGGWHGSRVGDAPVLHVGPGSDCTLVIDHIDRHGLTGEITIAGLIDHSAFSSVPGAEADVLSGMSFGGSPLRVYLGFLAIPDGSGEAFAIIALYDDRRIEVRVLRGGTTPLYGIYALSEGM